jgi:hypothetical protein
MRRTVLASLAISGMLAVAAGVLMPGDRAAAADGKGKGTNPGLLGWATFPAQSGEPRERLRSTAGKRKKMGSSNTYLRVGQPPAGTSSTAAKKKKPQASYWDLPSFQGGIKVDTQGAKGGRRLQAK